MDTRQKQKRRDAVFSLPLFPSAVFSSFSPLSFSIFPFLLTHRGLHIFNFGYFVLADGGRFSARELAVSAEVRWQGLLRCALRGRVKM